MAKQENKIKPPRPPLPLPNLQSTLKKLQKPPRPPPPTKPMESTMNTFCL